MTAASRVAQKSSGWRKAMSEVRGRAARLADMLERTAAYSSVPPDALIIDGVRPADIVRRLVHLLDSAEGNVRAEERAAWDQYAAEALAGRGDEARTSEGCAAWADEMLEERRKRFGGGT